MLRSWMTGSRMCLLRLNQSSLGVGSLASTSLAALMMESVNSLYDGLSGVCD